MSRITTCFQSLRHSGRKALIPYIVAGDPQLDATLPMMHTLVSAGADIIELGVPFSDPMADGPVIQRASERALAQGVNLHQVLELVRRFREDDQKTPVVLMGYLNPIEAMGYSAFVQAALDVGVDGVLIVDLPPEEAQELTSALYDAEIAPIFLLAPTSSPERIKKMAALGRGYLYYVSLKGVTGSSALNVSDVKEKIAAIRAVTDMPVGVGFGIKNAETAAAVSRIADAVVVGSAIVSRMAELASTPARMQSEIGAMVSAMRRAIDQASN